MERGCPAASSDFDSASISSSTSASNQASTSSRRSGAAAASESEVAADEQSCREDFASMSRLQDDVEDVCVSSNSQHAFAVVLDDESSTFEISSSNSLPTSAGAASTVGVVAVDDSSSTDTINGGGGAGHPSSNEQCQGFFNEDDPPVVCLINDDDDDDDEDIDAEPEEEDDDHLNEEDDDDVVDIVVAAIDCPNTSQVPLADGTIVAADGSKIFLETPVVEEAQPHPHPDPAVAQSELTGKPKRLSDEFLLGEDAEQAENQQQQQQAQARGMKPKPENPDTTCLHDRLMSVRLKQMSLTASTSSNPAPAVFAVGDIESIDLIERRDFETEQRLTGGIILRNTSKLNLSLIKSMAGGRGATGAAGGVASTAASKDDWPSSSNGRTVSSDSKVSTDSRSAAPK